MSTDFRPVETIGAGDTRAAHFITRKARPASRRKPASPRSAIQLRANPRRPQAPPVRENGSEVGAARPGARAGGDSLVPRVRIVAVLSAQVISRRTHGASDTVLVAGGNRLFLIRRAKDRVAGRCPLLGCEVSCLDARDTDFQAAMDQ